MFIFTSSLALALFLCLSVFIMAILFCNRSRNNKKQSREREAMPYAMRECVMSFCGKSIAINFKERGKNKYVAITKQERKKEGKVKNLS